MSRRMHAVPVFLVYMTINGFFSRMMGVIFSVFLILRLDLGPFQFVLLGTILEGTYLCSRRRPASSPTRSAGVPQ